VSADAASLCLCLRLIPNAQNDFLRWIHRHRIDVSFVDLQQLKHDPIAVAKDTETSISDAEMRRECKGSVR